MLVHILGSKEWQLKIWFTFGRHLGQRIFAWGHRDRFVGFVEYSVLVTNKVTRDPK